MDKKSKKMRESRVEPRQRGLRRICLEISLLLIISLASSFFLMYGLVSAEEDMLCGDVLYSYSFFRDNLHSLNRFGEFQWWNPRVFLGFPMYYTSMLGFNCTTPLFAFFCFIAWLLGKAGVVLQTYYPLYIAYFGYCVPLLFNLSLYLLARQIFRRQRLFFFVIIMSVFSPGVFFNIDGTIWEQTCYGLFFAAAFLNYLRRRTGVSVGLVILSVLVMAVSVNHLFLYWNVLFAPAFVIVCLIFHKVRIATLWKETLRAVSPLWMCLAVLMAFYCILPAATTFSHGEDILRWSLGERTYQYEALAHGNPLQFATISTPGVVYQWEGHDEERRYELYPLGAKRLGLRHSYLGLMALPLVFFGALFGRKRWRLSIFVLLAGVASVGVLSAYSPLFSTLLAPPTPLQAVNHYGDSLFYTGGSVLLILLAGLGFDVLTRFAGKLRWWFLAFFLGSGLFSISLFMYVNRHESIGAHAYGLLFVMLFLFVSVLIWLALAKGRRMNRIVITILLSLILIDVTAVAYSVARYHLWRDAEILDEPDADTIGIGSDNVAARYGHYLLYLKHSRQATIDIRKLHALMLVPSGGSMAVEDRTYNTLTVTVNSPHETTLVWTDCWFKYWRATVDGKPVAITKAYNAFKSVRVPAGESQVVFSFSPGPVPFLLLSSHIVVILTACAVLVCGIRQRRKTSGTSA